MPDAPEYGHENDEVPRFGESNSDHLSVILMTGEPYEIKAVTLGPSNGPMACTLCVRVPSDWMVDCGPVDIVCPQCAEAIARAVEVRSGTYQTRETKVKKLLDLAQELTGLSEEDCLSILEGRLLVEV